MTTQVFVPDTLDFLPARAELAPLLGEWRVHRTEWSTLHAGRDRVLLHDRHHRLFRVGASLTPLADDVIAVGPGFDGVPRLVHTDGSIGTLAGRALHAPGHAGSTNEVWGLPWGELVNVGTPDQGEGGLVGGWRVPGLAVAVVPAGVGVVRSLLSGLDAVSPSGQVRWHHDSGPVPPSLVGVVVDVVWYTQPGHRLVGLDVESGAVRYEVEVAPEVPKGVVSADGGYHTLLPRLWSTYDLASGGRLVAARPCGGAEGAVHDRYEHIHAITARGDAVVVDRHHFVHRLDAEDPSQADMLVDAGDLVTRVAMLDGAVIAHTREQVVHRGPAGRP